MPDITEEFETANKKTNNLYLASQQDWKLFKEAEIVEPTYNAAEAGFSRMFLHLLLSLVLVQQCPWASVMEQDNKEQKQTKNHTSK